MVHQQSHIRLSYSSLNRRVFNCFFKVSVFVRFCRLNGREFYAFGPAYEKLRSPNLSFSCRVSYRKLLADKVSLFLLFKPYKKLDYSIPVWFNFSKKWFNRLFMDYFSIHWLMAGDVLVETCCIRFDLETVDTCGVSNTCTLL